MDLQKPTIKTQTESQRIANQSISSTAQHQASQRAKVGANGIIKDGVAITHEKQSKIIKKHAKDYDERRQLAIDSIKYQADIFNNFVESGTKKQTIEDAALFLSEQNKSLENTPSYSVIPSIDDVNTAGYKAAEGGFDELSGISKKAYQKASSVASTIRTGTPILEEKLNTHAQGVGTFMGFPVRSTANLIEMSGMVPGGVETMARHPGVIAPAFGRGAYDATIGTAHAFKENPAQTTSDIVTAALFFGAGGKLAGSTRTVGTRVPRLTRTTVKPDILIKGEIPLATAPKVQAPTPGLVPYKGKPMPGMDLTPYKPTTPGKTPIPPYSEPNFFIGQRLGPSAAEGYIRVPAKMAKTLQKEYSFSGARNVKTDFGSFVELQGMKPRTQPKTGEFQRIPQAQDSILIGELPKGKSGRVKNPYRMEHKLKIEEADLESGTVAQTIPGNIIEASGKAIPDPLKITGGIRDPFKFNEFMASEKGTLKPTRFKNPVKEMFPERMFEPQPQFKQGGKVALKERGNNPAISDLQNIFDRSKAMHESKTTGVQARSRTNHATGRTGTSVFPALSLGGNPFSDTFISAVPKPASRHKPEGKFNTIITPSTRGKSSPLPNIVPSTAPSTKRAPAPFQDFANKITPTATFPSRVPIEPYIKPKSQSRVSKKKRGKRSADYYQITNPIKDIKELMKQ